MTETPYTPPVDQLLTYGEAELVKVEDWPDYLALGIGPEHIPELLRMVDDVELNEAESDNLEIWAPIHALRALGQLRAESTIEPLLQLLTDHEDDEWIQEEMPRVFGLIGPAAIPWLSAYLADTSHTMYARTYAASALAEIAKNYPESRTLSIAAIMQTLERFEENDPELNAFIIGDLGEIEAVDTLPLIEKAFEAERVDESIIDLDWVLEDFGLKERKPLEIPHLKSLFSNIPASDDIPYKDAINRAPTPAYPEPLSFPARDSYAQRLPAPTKFSGNKKQGKGKKQKSHKKR